jgi:hypothetical protein
LIELAAAGLRNHWDIGGDGEDAGDQNAFCEVFHGNLLGKSNALRAMRAAGSMPHGQSNASRSTNALKCKEELRFGRRGRERVD